MFHETRHASLSKKWYAPAGVSYRRTGGVSKVSMYPEERLSKEEHLLARISSIVVYQISHIILYICK